MRAQTANEALRNDHFDGGCNEEGLDVHVDESRECAGCIVSVQCAEDKVSGEGGANSDISSFAISDFLDHDHIDLGGGRSGGLWRRSGQFPDVFGFG